MRDRLRLLYVLVAAMSGVSVLVACLREQEDDLPVRDMETRGRRRGPEPSLTTGAPKPEADPPLPDGGKPPGRIYAHTATTLYRFDPLAMELARIGDFGCLEAGDRVLDIALDRDSVMYGTTDRGFLTISPLDASCEYRRRDTTLKYPNSLAFVPLGTVDDTQEALVGYQFDPAPAISEATTYVRIDLATGALTKIGELNDPSAPIRYKSSGDLIALIRNGNKAYLTVRAITPDAGTGNDFLAEVDPSTGRIKTVFGDTMKKELWGFGQWAGTGYAFSANGEIIALEMATGAARTVMTLAEDGGTGSWYGAGVTTDSPTKP